MANYYMRQADGRVFETDSPHFYNDCTRVTVKEGKEAIRRQALETLRKILKPGDTVYNVLRHVSASGMSRRIDFYAIQDNHPIYLSGYIAGVLEITKLSNKRGLTVGGCGMDMGFHIVYQLGHAMWPDGTPSPHGTRNGKADSAGGYALNHAWI